MSDPIYPYWLAISEWMRMPKDQQEDIRKRYALIGGAMKVFATEQEAKIETEKHLASERI